MNNAAIITTWDTEEQLAHAVAHFIVLENRKAIARKGSFTMALSGGSTPKMLYELLAKQPYHQNIAWKKTVIAFGDERFVPHTSPESNYKMAMDALLSRVPIPKKNILGISTKNLSPQESARQYEAAIRNHVSNKNPFDLVLLGMGEDGHTASVFPGSDLLDDNRNWIRSVWVEEKKMDRISFTLPFINRANNIAFLVAGQKKSSMLKTIFSAKGKMLPAAQVRNKGSLFFFLDKEAATQL